MWDKLRLLGYLVTFSAILWLILVALLRKPRRRGAWVAVVGVSLFLMSIILLISLENRMPAPQMVAAVPEGSGLNVTPFVEEQQRQYSCSHPAVFSDDVKSTYREGDMRYSLISTESFPGTQTSNGGASPLVVILDLKNEGRDTQEANPWFDFWVMPSPSNGVPSFPPQPVGVDILELEGPVPIPQGETLTVEPGTSCTLHLTFNLSSEAERTFLNIGYVRAFDIQVRSRERTP